MFLFKFFQQVAADRKLGFFSQNLPDFVEPSAQDHPYCLAPVRTFEFERRSSEPIKRIFHVRDPRDILVSEYFSFGWIHPDDEKKNLSSRRTEIQQMSIDEYVLQQPKFSRWPLEQKFKPLQELDLDHESYCVVRYEEMVLDFPAWVSAVIKPFEFRRPQKIVARYVKKFAAEFNVDSSESMSHKRKITPGDHREKLKPETIEQLNLRFEGVLSAFGYDH